MLRKSREIWLLPVAADSDTCLGATAEPASDICIPTMRQLVIL